MYEFESYFVIPITKEYFALKSLILGIMYFYLASSKKIQVCFKRNNFILLYGIKLC